MRSKPRALKKRAAEAGVDEEKIDEADDADDVAATLVALIMEKEQENSPPSELRDELETLKPRALKARAREIGVDEEKLDEADDADDVKGTLIALIIEKTAEVCESHAAAAAALAKELEPMKPRAL